MYYRLEFSLRYSKLLLRGIFARFKYEGHSDRRKVQNPEKILRAFSSLCRLYGAFYQYFTASQKLSPRSRYLKYDTVVRICPPFESSMVRGEFAHFGCVCLWT